VHLPLPESDSELESEPESEPESESESEGKPVFRLGNVMSLVPTS
jgi:hypothetical protein